MKVTERSSIPLSATTCNHSQINLSLLFGSSVGLGTKYIYNQKLNEKIQLLLRVEKITPGDVSFIVAPTPNRVIKTRRDARPKSEIKKR